MTIQFAVKSSSRRSEPLIGGPAAYWVSDDGRDGAVVLVSEPAAHRAFGILLGFAVVAFVVCMVRLARAYHPQKYVYLPLLGAIKKSKEEFLDFARFMAGARAKCSTSSKSSSTSTSSTPRIGTRETTTTGATSFTWLGSRSFGS